MTMMLFNLAIINPASIHCSDCIERYVNDFSTACYLITRHHAEKLVRLHCRGDKYKLDQGMKPRAVADDLIYNSGNTYAIPLFLYKIELGSDIHDLHVDVFHKSSYDGLWQFWRADSVSRYRRLESNSLIIIRTAGTITAWI